MNVDEALAWADAQDPEDVNRIWDRDNALALHALAAEVRRLTNTQFCGYCGWQKTGSSWDDLQAHIRECDKHPLRKAEADLAAARAEAARLREALTAVQAAPNCWCDPDTGPLERHRHNGTCAMIQDLMATEPR